jgi:membrane-associated phospholipid phosphatase
MTSPVLSFVGAFIVLLAAAYGVALTLTHGVRRLGRKHLPPLVHPVLWLLVVGAGLVYGVSLLAELAEEVREADEVVAFDKAVSNAVAPFRVPVLVAIFKAITTLGSAAAVWVVGSATVLYLWWRGRRQLIAPMCVTVLGAQLTTWLTKHALDRERPPFVLGLIEDSPSFPSGHTTAAMAAYGFIAYLIARERSSWRTQFELLFWSGVLILLVGFSRVFLGVHFASDVAGGLLVGTIWLLAGALYVEWRERA